MHYGLSSPRINRPENYIQEFEIVSTYISITI